MKELYGSLLFLIALTAFSNCSTKSTPAVYSDEYDKLEDHTSAIVFPYGKIIIPGQWVKASYDHISRQHFFKNADSVTFSVALNNWKKCDFYNQGMTPEDFVQQFYETASENWLEQTEGQVKIIKTNKERNYIICNLKEETSPNNYFLFGLKNKISFSLYVTSNTWNEAQEVALLEKIYNE